MSNTDQYLKANLLKENWKREIQAFQLYKRAAEEEQDLHKREILNRLAEIEFEHAKLWENVLRELRIENRKFLADETQIEKIEHAELMKRIRAVENSNSDWYRSQRSILDDPNILRIIDRIDTDEMSHSSTVEKLDNQQSNPIEERLSTLWGKERWHKRQTGDWVGDAIYGINDGLGAIFGIIAGVAGYTNSSHIILVSGFFGALASTLSMGAGAYLAAKTENELLESEIAHERREILDDPSHEIEELALLYQLKGFTNSESISIANRIANDPDQFVKAMAQEELGIHESNEGNPWKSALYGSISTLIGGIIPLVPFFFFSGISAMVTAAAVSLIAHFAVGAAKSLVTTRNWWSSGLEMTAAGVIVGVVAYGLGLIGSLFVT